MPGIPRLWERIQPRFLRTICSDARPRSAAFRYRAALCLPPSLLPTTLSSQGGCRHPSGAAAGVEARIIIPRAAAGAGLLLLRRVSSGVLAAGPGLVLQELPQSSQIPGEEAGALSAGECGGRCCHQPVTDSASPASEPLKLDTNLQKVPWQEEVEQQKGGRKRVPGAGSRFLSLSSSKPSERGRSGALWTFPVPAGRRSHSLIWDGWLLLFFFPRHCAWLAAEWLRQLGG